MWRLRWRKILDIKVPSLGKAPDAVVIVATIRALKMHGGLAKDQLAEENLPALQKGFANLEKTYSKHATL